jgi:integrase/recombinase XerD
MVLRDVSLEQNRLTVRPFETGKKSAARIIPFGRTTKNCIWQYLAQREDTGDNTAPLICTKDYKFMDRNQINKILERLSRASGVENVHAHRFRHTFAIEYLRNGGNIFTLQYQLGHRSLTMVRYYLTLSEADIDAAHRVASPADKWRL